jgi:hypothetical protein
MPAKSWRNRLPIWMAVAGLVVAWFLIIRAFVAPDVTTWSWPFVPKEDGYWRAMTIDERDVSGPQRYTLLIDGGQIRGGYDGCNNWGFNTSPSGERGVTSDARECLVPGDATYSVLAKAEARMTLLPNGSLLVEAAGHSGLFRRVARTGDTE